MKTYEILVSGKVQGVGYRYFVLQQASSLQLVGNVRNQPDGSVKILAAGTEVELKIFMDSLRHGPPRARVQTVDFREISPAHSYDKFRIEF
ncbi:MAG: acylphosphatase [Candidatus Cloacimonetes bacterium]|nr:acylphosphatase [Candidatus Cloacimonadota bacterium]